MSIIQKTMEIPLLLFAKAPIAGKVKTRLQTHCSKEFAAEIAQVLLEESLIRTTEVWPGPVYLSVALDLQHTFLQKMAQRYGVEMSLQGAGNLGQKMHDAFEQFGYPAAIMGCDAPHILADDLRIAYDLLSQHKSVLGPSIDGGYYFIGLSESNATLFNDVAWGTGDVRAQTLVNAQKSNTTFEFLSALSDIDEWQDVLEAAPLLPRLQALLDTQAV